MIALLGALREEVACLRKRMTVTETASESSCKIFRGTWRGRGPELLLVQTGMGKQRAEAATRYVLDHYPITILISLGFAGALVDELNVGDIVLYSAICCAQIDEATIADTRQSYDWSDEWFVRSKCALDTAAVSNSCRPGVTVSHIMRSPDDKRELADTLTVDVVDMESYWIAEIASEKQIPCLIIRSVSDTRREKLLPFELMMNGDGNVLWREAAGYFLRQPKHLVVVPRLYRNAREAQRRLALATDSVIAELQHGEGH